MDDESEVQQQIAVDESHSVSANSQLTPDSALNQAQGKSVAQLLSSRFCWNPGECREGAPNDHGSIHCSLVDSIDGIDVVDDSQFPDPRDLRSRHPVPRHGYLVKVAEIGSIKIRELIIKPRARRL